MTFTTRFLPACVLALLMAVAWPDEPQKKKTVPQPPPKAIVEEVAKLGKDLGADSFRVRRKATKRLLEIANTKKSKGDETIRPFEGYVWTKMMELSESKDPEVAQRAKEIHKKLRPDGYVDISELGQLKYELNPGDTIAEIASIFDSKPSWIKAANPGLRSDKDLKKFELVNVPVSKNSDWNDSIGEEVEIVKERKGVESW